MDQILYNDGGESERDGMPEKMCWVDVKGDMKSFGLFWVDVQIQDKWRKKIKGHMQSWSFWMALRKDRLLKVTSIKYSKAYIVSNI